MEITVDTHVHFYPNYDFGRFLNAARENLSGPEKVLLLTERQTENFFHDLPRLLQTLQEDCPLLESMEGVHRLSYDNGDHLWIAAGSQYVSTEGIEVLNLLSSNRLNQRLPIRKLIESLSDGVTVLPWSPGKWSGKRGEIVTEIFTSRGAREIFLGDILMGQVVSPALFRGAQVLRGSDPLPLPGEERFVGRYGIRGESQDLNFHPQQALREFLRAGMKSQHGRKLSLYESFSRILRWEVARRFT